MTRNDFVSEIVKSYENARLAIMPHDRVHREKSRSVSSICEDILAYFVASHVTDIDIMVNQPIRHSKKKIMPDLSLYRNGELTCSIELKQDLGWCRNLHENISKFDSEIEDLIESGSVVATNKLGKSKKLNVSSGLKRCFAVISDKNISKRELDINIDRFTHSKNNHLLFLTTGCHPNNYLLGYESIMKSIIINNKAFDLMLSCAAA